MKTELVRIEQHRNKKRVMVFRKVHESKNKYSGDGSKIVNEKEENKKEEA